MTPKEKHQEEQNELKTSRINRILESAFNLFSEKGIDTITMNDIASTAEIGVASLYRYFATKDEIAIRTAIWAWSRQKDVILPALQSDSYESLTGYAQIEKIFKMFVDLYDKEKTFLRFIYFFDSYINRQKISYERLFDYEGMIAMVQDIVANAINKGISDGSINQEYAEQQKDLYFTTMHSLFSMSQKLSLAGNMLAMDSAVDGTSQMKLLSVLLLKAIKA